MIPPCWRTSTVSDLIGAALAAKTPVNYWANRDESHAPLGDPDIRLDLGALQLIELELHRCLDQHRLVVDSLVAGPCPEWVQQSAISNARSVTSNTQ